MSEPNKQRDEELEDQAVEWAANSGIPHTKRDGPAWEYDAAAYMVGYRSRDEEVARYRAALESIEAATLSWVITPESAYFLQPHMDKIMDLARAALGKEKL